MSDDQNKKEEKKYPWVSAGAMILSQDGKFFLMKSPKWQNKLTIPGGHVEWGEKVQDALLREVEEETGAVVENPRLLNAFDLVHDKDYKDGKDHFIALNYLVDLVSNKNEIKLDGEEGTEVVWLSPDEILEKKDIHETIKENVKMYKKMLETEEYKKGWQRALADYKNLQNEIAARRGEWVKMSELQILEEFIPVYENFKKAFAHREQMNEENGWKQWSEGVGHIMKQFGDILKAHNLEEIKTVGEKFDPKYHEAVGEEENEEVDADTILKEVSGGYKMGDRVVRPARVIIAK
ncbi:MAG: nucleotide exchange factor GrpE [Patescibacteria group bacterium]